ncbi:hypothetical protein [Priestia megaterium]
MLINLYSPFIPDEKTLDFNVSFWAGLTSGLISGLFTGLIVGIFLWKMQKRSQELQEKKEAEREFTIFVQKLTQTFMLTDANMINSEGSEFLPKNILEVRSLIYEQPLLYWRERIEQQNLNQLLVAIENLNVVDTTLKQVSSLLDTRIQQLLINHTTVHFLKEYTSAFYAIIMGIDNDELKSWIHGINHEKIDELRELQNEFPDLIDQYKNARESLISSADNLKSLITNLNTPT